MAAGKILQQQGCHRAAAESFETALDTMGNSTADNKGNIAVISGWLAGVYGDQGQWKVERKGRTRSQ